MSANSTYPFDVSDESSWYVGPMSRREATDILMNENERGVFLVRDSNSIIGDYVLCVREDAKVSNYIINKVQERDQVVYHIGDQSFENLPKLLTFYTLHYLDTTPLRRPAIRRVERVVAKFDFSGSDQDDLPFRKGELLTIVRKDEEQWWSARNAEGRIGQIPVPYVRMYDGPQQPTTAVSLDNPNEPPGKCMLLNQSDRSSGAADFNSGWPNSNALDECTKKSDLSRKLPAYARVKQARVPNAYDKTALRLEVGDIIKVTKTNINGQWEGELDGRNGHFPFTHVEFIDDNSHQHHHHQQSAHPAKELED